MKSTTIVRFATNDVVVGIMIVLHQKYGVDMEMVNLSIHINTESIRVGNTIEKLNGSKVGSMV